MSHSDFKILREIYHLLGEFEPDAIAAAGRRPHMSENMRIALNALAKEARSNNAKGARRFRLGTPDKTSRVSAINATSNPRDYRRALMRFLLDEKRFPDKNSLANFAKKMEVPKAANPKYSRERVAHYIAKFAAENESFKKRLASFVASVENEGDAQTKGWLGLILGTN